MLDFVFACVLRVGVEHILQVSIRFRCSLFVLLAFRKFDFAWLHSWLSQVKGSKWSIWSYTSSQRK